MKKQPEVEESIKRLIREELAREPSLSVERMRTTLYSYGWKTVHGPLDWAYVNKMIRSVRIENLARVENETRMERLAWYKERQRIMTKSLMEIVEGKPTYDVYADKTMYPTYEDRCGAAATITKMDTALLFAEEQVNAISTKLATEPAREVTVTLLDAPKRRAPRQRWMRAVPRVV